jgi:hypothetical protein
MDGKFLGKITKARFGYVHEGFLFGLQVDISFDGYASTQAYSMNVSKNCKYESVTQRKEHCEGLVDNVADTLKKAKVDFVDELEGMPIEVTCVGSAIKEWRILEEVL